MTDPQTTPKSPSAETACSAFVVGRFPKPCRPRKRHRCYLCWQRIEIGEECCRTTGLEPGEGHWTIHMHPECFDRTKYWDEGDWESHMRGDMERPPVRMSWQNDARAMTPAKDQANDK